MNNVDSFSRVLCFLNKSDLGSNEPNKYLLALYINRLRVDPDKSLFSTRSKKSISKARFYQAVMGRFLDTKALQLVNLCDDSEPLKDELFDSL